jgi:hypothetical protein
LRRIDHTSPFHVDHIVAVKHEGTTELDNLCLACFQCNAFKGSNVAAADPQTGKPTFLYHPRRQDWHAHFKVNLDGTLSGLTPEGRVTIAVLRINDESRLGYRQIAMQASEYPCSMP